MKTAVPEKYNTVNVPKLLIAQAPFVCVCMRACVRP
jgi:hypothetical protein